MDEDFLLDEEAFNSFNKYNNIAFRYLFYSLILFLPSFSIFMDNKISYIIPDTTSDIILYPILTISILFVFLYLYFNVLGFLNSIQSIKKSEPRNTKYLFFISHLILLTCWISTLSDILIANELSLGFARWILN